MDKEPRRRRMRFSLGTLLFAMVLVAGFFAGYHWGVEQKQVALQKAAIVTKVYGVGDFMVVDGPDFDQLIDVIVRTYKPNQWAENNRGGTWEIRPAPASVSLMVACPAEAHDDIFRLLDQFHQRSRAQLAKAMERALKSIDELRETHTVQIRSSASSSRYGFALRLERSFELGTEVLEAKFGPPIMTTDAKQFAAVWDYDGGELCLALNLLDDQSESLVLGWSATMGAPHDGAPSGTITQVPLTFQSSR